MRYAEPLAALALAASCMASQAQTTAFDGAWKLTLVCPPANDEDVAKGYKFFFDTDVRNGELRATHGTEGEPGWQFLHGQIAADGSALLMLDGIVNSPEHAIGKSPKGKPFSYRVKAKFEGNTGVGERTSGRVCNLRFTR